MTIFDHRAQVMALFIRAFCLLIWVLLAATCLYYTYRYATPQ